MFWPHLSFPSDPIKLHTKAQGHTLKAYKKQEISVNCNVFDWSTSNKNWVFPRFLQSPETLLSRKTCKEKFWAKGLTEQCQCQNQSCKCIGCLWIAISFGIFRNMNAREPCVIHVPSPHASPDETHMFCGCPVIFSWNHRPTANNKQPKTSLQILGWEKWQRVRSCPATAFLGFAMFCQPFKTHSASV